MILLSIGAVKIKVTKFIFRTLLQISAAQGCWISLKKTVLPVSVQISRNPLLERGHPESHWCLRLRTRGYVIIIKIHAASVKVLLTVVRKKYHWFVSEKINQCKYWNNRWSGSQRYSEYRWHLQPVHFQENEFFFQDMEQPEPCSATWVRIKSNMFFSSRNASSVSDQNL